MPEILIIHLTDPHFGEDHRPAMFWRRVIWHQDGHDIQLARALTDFLPDIRFHLPQPVAASTPVHYVVSGDLTCRGSEKNFATAYSFLLDKSLWSPSAGPVGLGLPNSFSGVFEDEDPRTDKAATTISLVPGNHDHWEGRFFLRGPTRHLPMPQTPWSDARIQIGDLSLDLFGIDSFADAPRGRHYSQSGRFHDLSDLENGLREFKDHPPSTHAAAAIVVHHSLEPDWKNLEADSARRLLSLADRYGVTALLTGHTHTSLNSGFAGSQGSVWRTRELRAATTCCGPAVVGKQGFLVHHLSTDARGGVWRSYEFLFNANGSFTGIEMDPQTPIRF
jgi:Calcineurin-like phosphoesterase